MPRVGTNITLGTRRGVSVSVGGGANGLRDGLVAYWALDETSGDAIDAHADFDAVANGTPGTAAGVIGTARDLDGTSQAFLATGLGTLTALTIAGWVRLDVANTTTRRFLSLASGNDSNIAFVGSANNGTATLDFAIGAFASTAVSDGIGGLDTSWHHFAMTYTGTVARFYRDGVKIGNDLTVSVTFVDAKVALGRRAWAATGWLDGKLDECGLWSRALSATDIVTLYGGGAGLAYQSFT